MTNLQHIMCNFTVSHPCTIPSHTEHTSKHSRWQVVPARKNQLEINSSRKSRCWMSGRSCKLQRLQEYCWPLSEKEEENGRFKLEKPEISLNVRLRFSPQLKMSGVRQNSTLLRRYLFIRLGLPCFASTNAKVDKKLLSELRKRTGYPFSNCLKALQLYSDNIAQAEDWLHKKAAEEGWAKAEKLKGRLANQGLIGSVISNNIAAIVEVNCETDFVARNELFQGFVKSVALAAQAFRIRVYQQTLRLQGNSGSDVAHLREVIPVHKLQGLQQGDSTEFIQDNLVSVVGKVGEKVTLKPAITIATPTTNRMFSYGHGPVSGNTDDFSYGGYLSLITLKQLEGRYDLEIDRFGSGLAKHVTGMGPERISPQSEEDDKALLSQPYLLDSSRTVGEHCVRRGIEVVDFIRLHCGE